MLGVFIVAITPMPAIAYTSFDGTYDYSYGFNILGGNPITCLPALSCKMDKYIVILQR